MTIAEIIRTYGIKMHYKTVGPGMYSCRITTRDPQSRDVFGMSFMFESNGPPKLDAALAWLLDLANQHEGSKVKRKAGKRGARLDLRSFQRWCFMEDKDPYSETDHTAYLLIRKLSEQLRYVLGDEAYKQLLEAV